MPSITSQEALPLTGPGTIFIWPFKTSSLLLKLFDLNSIHPFDKRIQGLFVSHQIYENTDLMKTLSHHLKTGKIGDSTGVVSTRRCPSFMVNCSLIINYRNLSPHTCSGSICFLYFLLPRRFVSGSMLYSVCLVLRTVRPIRRKKPNAPLFFLDLFSSMPYRKQ